MAEHAASNAAERAVIVTALVDGFSQRWLTGRLTTDQARELLRTALIAQIGS